MLKAILAAANTSDFVVVEGIMLTDLPNVYSLLSRTIFLTITKETCVQRRDHRVYDPPDELGYFDQIVWPAYEKTLADAKQLERLTILDGNATEDIYEKVMEEVR